MCRRYEDLAASLENQDEPTRPLDALDSALLSAWNNGTEVIDEDEPGPRHNGK